MSLKNGYFCAFFVDILWGKCNSSFYTDSKKYWQWEHFLFGASLGFLDHFSWGSWLWAPVEGRKFIAKKLLLLVSKLVNLTNQRGKKSEIITSSSCKRILIIILRTDVLFITVRPKKIIKTAKIKLNLKRKILKPK